MDDPASVTSDPVAPPAKVVKRTYGRKKDASAILPDDALATTTTAAQNSTPLFDEKRTTTPDYEGSPAPSGSPAPKADFGWKAKLKEVDELFADDDDDTVNKFTKASSDATPAGDVPATEDDSFTTANSSIFDAAPPRASSPATSEGSPMPQIVKKRKAKLMSSASYDEDMPSSSASPKMTGSSSRLRRKKQASGSSSESGGENEAKRVAIVKLTRTSASPVTEEDEDGAQEPGPSKHKKRRATKATEKAGKIKKPTKKDELESKKAHARMMAEQQASIPKESRRLNLDGVLEKISKRQVLLDSKSQPVQQQPSSDPIQQFSSPARGTLTASIPRTKPLQTQPSFPKTLEDSDEELVDVKDILKHDKVQKGEVEAKEQRRKALERSKQRAIELNALKLASNNQSDEDSDDDLELEIVGEGSKTKVKQYSLESKIRPGRKSWPVELGETQALQAAAQPHFNARPTEKSTLVRHNDLLKIMRNKGMKQSEHITKAKQAHWVEKGGKLKPQNSAPAGGDALAMVVERLRKSREGQTSGQPAEGGEEVDDGSDEDWNPNNNGSGSETSLSGEEQENAPVEQVEDAAMDDKLEEDEDENSVPKLKSGRRPAYRHVGRAVMSDEEDEGSSLRPPRVLVPDTSMVLDSPNVLNQARARRTSMSSLDDTSFDENDNKENDMSLMFDQGEDKENLAVARLHSPSSWSPNNSQNRSIFDLADGMRQRLSMSPSNPGPSSSSKRVRQPLQQRKLDDDLDMDEEFPPLSATVVGSDSPTRVHLSSASSSPKPLQPAFGEGLGGFTQLFNDEDGGGDENMPPPKSVLKPAFSFTNSLSGDSQPRPLQFGGPLSFSASPTQKSFGGMKPFGDGTKELSLTLDTKLQPALEVNSQVRRKAEAIFEKEQNLVLEEAVKKPQPKPVLYVTETGLLTQTRPDVSTPVVYRSVSATQNTIAPPDSVGTLPPSSTQRLPLSTLSFTSDVSSPTQPTRLSRLRRGVRPVGTSPRDEDKIGSSSKNAFALMLEAQSKQHRKAEAKKLEKSLFVEGEAQESDEDEEFGFGKKKGSKSDEEDDDDDDENAVIENLVDDTKKEDENEDLVLEKVQEQQAQDDQELEKYHMKAIEGKFRGKRRGGGIGLNSDSESEGDDDEARRLRQKIHKKRRVAGDTLEELGRDEKSEAFVRGYEEDLNDDAVNDFAHLVQDEMDVDDDDENDEPTETVNALDLQAELRVAAQNKDKGKQRFDPENADWVERTNWSDDDEKYGVKDVEMPRKSATGPRRQALGQDGEMTLFTKRGEWDGAQLEAWRKEQSNRNFGGTRGAGAVTGHGKKNATSSKSSRIGDVPSMGPGAEKRGTAKSASALAIVSSKQSRFESAQ